jgi:membrane-bound metal-dependent hydrolase YbcI (DUF457 family)
MANFNTHFTVSAGASALVSSTLLSMDILAPQEALVSFFLGSLGGLLPDIDSAYSTSIKIGFNIFSFLATITVIFLYYKHYSLVELIILSCGVFISIRYLFLEIFRKISTHRGMFHSIPVAIIWGLLVVILFDFLELKILTSWVYGLMVTIGYIVHLLLDELYSVDLGNIRMKKSFGTAFKFFSIQTTFGTIQTIFIYIFLVLLFNKAPNPSVFVETLFTQEAWLTFQDILLPSDGKWFTHL